MSKKSLAIIQSIVGSELYAKNPKKGNGQAVPGKPLVTLSRFFGTPDVEVATLLAERLNVQLYDKVLLKNIVKQAKGDKHLLELLDERVTSIVDDLVHAFFSKKSTNKDTYFRYMAKVILGIGPTGGVILGRGAHLLLPKQRAFRVRLDGSLKVCSKRVAKVLEVKNSKAEKLILKTNAEWRKFTRDVAKRYPTSVKGYDLTINTDIYSPEQMVRIIAIAMEEAGFQVPKS